jgi:hypothetical protein
MKKKADDLCRVFVRPSLYVFTICAIIVSIILLAVYFGKRSSARLDVTQAPTRPADDARQYARSEV